MKIEFNGLKAEGNVTELAEFAARLVQGKKDKSVVRQEHKRFSKEDYEFVMSNIGKLKASVIAKQIGRKTASVNCLIWRIKQAKTA